MNRNILVIDDDKNIQDSYKTIFMSPDDKSAEPEFVSDESSAGKSLYSSFQVITAPQGNNGYRLAREAMENNNPFAAAFINMGIPMGWDGLETAKALRKLDDRIYLVIVTAFVDKYENELIGVLKNNFLLLRKPFLKQEIYQLARNLCNSWSRDEELKQYRDHLEEMVNERKATLESAKQFNENIIHTVPSGLVVFTKKNIISISSRFRNMFQLKRGEYEGAPAEEFIEKFECVDKIIVQQILAGELTKKEDILCFPFNRSEECYLDISQSRINIGEVDAEGEFLLVVNDVTQRKQDEEKRKELEVQMLVATKMATLGEVSTGVVHEINQPLTFISGFLQTLALDLSKNKIEPERITKRLSMANQQVTRMTEIINHLRTFSRKDVTSTKENIQISDILDNAFMLLNEQVRLHKIHLVKNIQDPLPPILGNATQLEQVFINLLQNATDILDEKKDNRQISITIRAFNKSIKIDFSDNGSGIPTEVKEKIFEPFFTTKEVGKGTGLGLSIIYGIVRDHSGTLECNTTVGEGTTFTIKLPIK